MVIDHKNVASVNYILQRVVPIVSLEVKNNLIVCCWAAATGQRYTKVWLPDEFLPHWGDIFHRHVNMELSFLAFLVRWCYCQPTITLDYLREAYDVFNAIPFDLLENAGFPTEVHCIDCGTLVADEACCFAPAHMAGGPICLNCYESPKSYHSPEVVSDPDAVIEIPAELLMEGFYEDHEE